MQCFGITIQCNFPGGSESKESACIAGDIRDMGSIPGSGPKMAQLEEASLRARQGLRALQERVGVDQTLAEGIN